MPEIRVLRPTSVFAGSSVYQDVSQTPVPFGSLTDDSDVTYARLSADWNPETNVKSGAVISAVFQLNDPAFRPTHMMASIRARNPESFTAGVPVLHAQWIREDDLSLADYWSYSHNPEAVDGSINRLMSSTVTDWRRFDFYYGNNNIPDRTNQFDSNWQILSDDPQAIAAEYDLSQALQSAQGLRLQLTVQATSNLEPRRDYVDISEIEILVAGTARTPAQRGQLYVNLSTTKESPNWVSVCPVLTSGAVPHTDLRYAFGTPVFVGTLPLDDDNDATYIELGKIFGGQSDQVSYGLFGGTGATTTDITVTIAAVSNVTQHLSWNLEGDNTPGAVGLGDILVLPAGQRTEISVTLSDTHRYTGDPYDPAVIGSYLAQPGMMILTLFNNQFPTENGVITVYRAQVVTQGTGESGSLGHFNISTIPETPDWRDIHITAGAGTVYVSPGNVSVTGGSTIFGSQPVWAIADPANEDNASGATVDLHTPGSDASATFNPKSTTDESIRLRVRTQYGGVG